MRRAERLFEIIEILRRARRVVTAREIAGELEISVRTVYRDMADLMARRVPISGEAGVGYLLGADFDLPPLMFTSQEVEALAMGLRIAVSWGDEELAGAARRAMGKITAVVPPDHQAALAARHIVAPPHDIQLPVSIDLGTVRRAVRERLRLTFDYFSIAEVTSRRTIRPLTLAFFGPVWLLGGWCELRRDFRMFRADRITGLAVGEAFPVEAGKELADFKSGKQSTS